MLELRVCLVWSYLLVSTLVRFAHVLREETFLPHVTPAQAGVPFLIWILPRAQLQALNGSRPAPGRMPRPELFATVLL